MTMRMLPPSTGMRPTISPYGRTYTCALGSYIDVPDADGVVMHSNGWTMVGFVGSTTARPATPAKGDTFVDATLGYIIIFDRLTWRNPSTGAAV